MKETLFPIQTGLDSPCRTIENIDARKTETYDKSLGPEKQYQNMKIRGKNWKEWFGVTYQILSDKFTIKINKKEMDFESLVGYIGGYVGLFAGFAVAELPGMLSNGFFSMKQLQETNMKGIMHKFALFISYISKVELINSCEFNLILNPTG